ncbi:hypothetical protein GCM10010172_63770 [Paractinoplanes ferrugineus]|uniref:Uncharacterized protein n=1 Tax=Paractinoplanes ferrugineus TaxID=113564 RepID=A0A919MIH8_9ACTN|nr:hypothetical protein Afe05nite_09770 [Actinoplanes ferrugineus]
MQAGGPGATLVPGDQKAQLVPGGKGVTRADAGLDRLIGGAQAAGMGDRDGPDAAREADEDDPPGAGGPDHGARDGAEVDPTMPGQPGPGRRVEAPGDLSRLQRPQEDQKQGVRHGFHPDGGRSKVRPPLWTAALCG